MATWDELSDDVLQTCQSVFGRSVVYERAPLDPVTVTAIDAPMERGGENNAQPVGRHSRICVRVADFAEYPQRGATVTFDGRVYEIVDIQADSNGAAYLDLRFSDIYVP